MVGFWYNTTRYLFSKNIQGDIVSLLNEDGTLVATYVYDAYGNHKVYGSNGQENTEASFVGNINPFRYRGYYYDVETKLYYLNSRYYDPEVGRFLSPDILSILDETMMEANGLNLYMYCGNNPVMRVDPNGYFVITLSALIIAAIVGASLGAITGAVYGGISAYQNNQNIWAGIALGIIGGAIMGAGAAIGGMFLAPLLAGSGIIFSSIAGAGFFMGTTVSIGAALTIGLGVPLVTGFIAGAFVEIGTQLFNNNWHIDDWSAVGWSTLQSGIMNLINALSCSVIESVIIKFMSLGLPVSTAISAIITAINNGIITGIDKLINEWKSLSTSHTSFRYRLAYMQ